MKKHFTILAAASVLVLCFATSTAVTAADNCTICDNYCCENYVTEENFEELENNYRQLENEIRENYVTVDNFEDLKQNIVENYVRKENYQKLLKNYKELENLIRENYAERETLETFMHLVRENYITIDNLETVRTEISQDYISKDKYGNEYSHLSDDVENNDTQIRDIRQNLGLSWADYLNMFLFGMMGAALVLVILNRVSEQKSQKGNQIEDESGGGGEKSDSEGDDIPDYLE